MANVNFISYTYILDRSLQDLMAMSDLNRKQDGVFVDESFLTRIRLSNKVKKLFKSIACGNIGREMRIGSANVLVNTCAPQNNWRQFADGRVSGSYRYMLADETVRFDEIEFNNFAYGMFRGVGRVNFKEFSLGTEAAAALNRIGAYRDNLKFLEFEDIDEMDLKTIISCYYKYDSSVRFAGGDCRVISDGNRDYIHGSVFSEELTNNVLIRLNQEGIC